MFSLNYIHFVKFGKVTRGNSGHGVFPVTRKKVAHCSKILGFLVQLQRCASSVNTWLQHTSQ